MQISKISSRIQMMKVNNINNISEKPLSSIDVTLTSLTHRNSGENTLIIQYTIIHVYINSKYKPTQ